MMSLRVFYCRTSKLLPFCQQSVSNVCFSSRPPGTSHQTKCTSSSSQILQFAKIKNSNDFLKTTILYRTLSEKPAKKKRSSLVVKTLKEGLDVSTVVSFAESYVNVDSILSKAGYDRAILLSPTSSNTTSGVIAFLLYKLTSPIRLLLDSVMVPVVVRRLRYMGVMQPESAVNEQKLEKAISRIEEFDKKYDEIDLNQAVQVIRRRAAKRTERRDKQMETYSVTQKKIDKVFQKKKNAAGESKNEK